MQQSGSQELEDWLASVGPAMARLRKSVGASQGEVVAKMRLLRQLGSESSLGKAENGDVLPTTELLFTFLAALGSSPRQFVEALEVVSAELAAQRDPLQDALVAYLARARNDPAQRQRLLAMLEELPADARTQEVADAIAGLRGENGRATGQA